MKTLIAYATRYGATAKTAELLAKTLKEADGRVVELRNASGVGRSELSNYDSYIVGSSIAAGRWKGSAKRLAARMAALGKPMAIFVSAGGIINGKEPGSDPNAPPMRSLQEREAEAVAKYIDPIAAKLGLRPVATAAFGGRMAFFGKEIFDNWEAEPILSWAEVLKTKLK